MHNGTKDRGIKNSKTTLSEMNAKDRKPIACTFLTHKVLWMNDSDGE